MRHLWGMLIHCLYFIPILYCILKIKKKVWISFLKGGRKQTKTDHIWAAWGRRENEEEEDSSRRHLNGRAATKFQIGESFNLWGEEWLLLNRNLNHVNTSNYIPHSFWIHALLDYEKNKTEIRECFFPTTLCVCVNILDVLLCSMNKPKIVVDIYIILLF